MARADDTPESTHIDQTVPAFDPILDLLQGFRRSKTMFAAVSLGVFDALAEGARSLNELAESLPANPDALERLLAACVGLGLLERTADRFQNTATAQTYLCQMSPRRVTGYIQYSNNVMWKMWGLLEDAVREGTHRWPQAFGLEGPIFDHFFRTEDAKREFLLGMHGFGIVSSPHVVNAFDLSRFERIVDLGGATGHLAVAACQRYPQMRGVVFDLPAAIPMARDYVASTALDDRIEFVAGDFFRDALPPGDLYALGRIVHDWAEPKIRDLLGRVFAHLPPGGAVLIAEKILHEDRAGPGWAQMQSLNMLTCTEGKERTLSEYAALLRSLGFAEIQGCRTPSPLDAIIAFKSGSS